MAKEEFKQMSQMDIVRLLGIRDLPKEEREKIAADLEKSHKEHVRKNKGKVLAKLQKKKLIRKSEIERFSDDIYFEYLNIVVNFKPKKKDDKAVFMTVDKTILAERDDLMKQFNVKICDPIEAMELAKEEEKKELNYIG